MEHRFDPKQLHLRDRHVISVDPAASTRASADRTAISVIGNIGARHHVIDCIAGRWDYPQQVAMLTSVYAKHPDVDALLIERSSNGMPLYDLLKATTSLPLEEVTPRGSKESRAEATSALFESGSVLLARDAAWIPELVEEFVSFSAQQTSGHDDIVDSVCQGVNYLRDKAGVRCGIVVVGDQPQPDWGAMERFKPQPQSLL